MDPRLKIIRFGNPQEILLLLVRLQQPHQRPPRVQVIAQFGDIISCRLQRADLDAVYRHPTVKSMKAPRVMPMNALEPELEPFTQQATQHTSFSWPQSGSETEVVIGIIDFGFDFTHPSLINNGRTCFEKIWVQAARSDGNRYGYGRVLQQTSIQEALHHVRPFEKLGYHPGKGDVLATGMHGTHVLGIACGNGRVGRQGLAAGAPVIAVDMAAQHSNGADVSLGDSVKLVEALDFIIKEAGDRPLVINMSLGGHGDAHTGQTLVELAINNIVANRPGTAIVQSTGNYFSAKTHAHGKLQTGEHLTLPWLFKPADRTPNEMEIWYEGCDELRATITNPQGDTLAMVNGFEDVIIREGGREVGIVLHRRHEPNTGKNQLNILTNGKLAATQWCIHLHGHRIQDGRFHAYIERDDRGQSVFGTEALTTTHTTNSICNAPLAITVGAYNQNSQRHEVLPFSSSGPTIDGRMKPEVLAPGYQIEAACSAGAREHRAQPKLCAKSGSSMAAPYVASAIVQLLRQQPALDIHQIRQHLFKACIPALNEENDQEIFRSGYGYLDIQQLFHH
jgi:subtilisin family serine protease